MTVGDKIRQLRKEKNLSQADLAYETGLTKAAISMYELGARHPKIETLEILADYFNVDMDYITGRTITSGIVADDNERLIISQFRAMNDEGRRRVLQYIADLVDSGKYKGR